jgi:uncharacterized membrane protein
MNVADGRSDAPVRRSACSAPSRFGILPLVVVAAIALLVAVGFLLTGAGAIPPPPSVGGAPPIWFLFPLGCLLCGALIFFVSRPWGGNRYGGGGRGWPNELDADEVVRLRFARGDISKAQLDELLHELAETPR